MGSGVKKLAAVAVGAVVGFIQGNVPGAIAGAALAWYGAEQQEKLNTKSSLRDNEPSAQTVRSSKAPVRFILGRVSTGGILVWAQEQAGIQTEGEWLHLVYVLCEGAVDALEGIYLGEEEISTFGTFAKYELVVNPTQVNAFLKANCPDWKDEQIGRGLSYVRLSLQYNAEKFPSGIPDARFIVRGRTDIYDPRTGTSGYSANTALHILWFLRNRCGVPDDEIVFETFASAANVSDEAVTNADGSVSQRYRTACVIGADEQRGSVMQKLEAACAGKLIRVGGRWMLQAGAYYGPYDFEITEDMIVGPVSGNTETTNDAAINTVRGTFIDPSQSWTETDYPEVSVAEWIVEDGGEAAESLTYSYVTDAYQPQRLANIVLRKRRAAGALSLPMNFMGYNCRPGRVVRVNLPSLNILGEFIVTNWSMSGSEGCNVSVAQYEAAQFDDAVGQPYNPLGFINLPTGGLGSPTGLAWTVDTSAEVVQGVLSWTAPTGIVSEYVVIVRQGRTAIQSHNVPATSTRCIISGLASGDYSMSVAAKGPMARSGEATINISVNGPPIPESCVVQSSIDSITLIPSNTLHGLNGGFYEYFFTTNPQGQVENAQYLGQGLSFTHTGLAFFTNYYYFVRSVNAYGKSAFLYVPAATSNDVSAYLAALGGKIDKLQLSELLNSRIDLVDGFGPNSVNERLEELKADIGDVVDALVYVPTDAYVRDNTVRVGDNLWTAIAAVPAAANGSNGPPNPTYWVNSGQSIRTANALAAQVTKNTADIVTVDGKTSVTASQLQAVQASYRDDAGQGVLADALKGWDTTASYAQEVKVRTEQDFAQAQRTTTLDARVGTNEARVTTIETTTATDRQATAERVAQLDSRVGTNESRVSVVENTVATNQQATAQQFVTLGTSVGDNSAAIQAESTARSGADGALSTQIGQVQAVANNASAAVQTVSSAQATTDGKLTAMYAVKLQVNANGQYVVAGIGAGIENVGGVLQSDIIFQANTIAFASPNGDGSLSYPYIISGGKNYFNSVFIQDASIGVAKLTQSIQSANFVSGKTGLMINFVTGEFELNSTVGAGGRQTINNRGGKVFDENDAKRYQWGDLSA
jgi:hypothetical protein